MFLVADGEFKNLYFDFITPMLIWGGGRGAPLG